jgi:hypothetical protein
VQRRVRQHCSRSTEERDATPPRILARSPASPCHACPKNRATTVGGATAGRLGHHKQHWALVRLWLCSDAPLDGCEHLEHPRLRRRLDREDLSCDLAICRVRDGPSSRRLQGEGGVRRTAGTKGLLELRSQTYAPTPP